MKTNLRMKKGTKVLNVILETASAEFGSALEMISACKLSGHKNFCYGYFNHAKDEYNHAETFFSFLSKYGKKVSPKIARQFRFSTQSLIGKYVKKQGYLFETMHLKDFIAYVYTNELLAKQSFEGILELLNPNSKEGRQVSQIMDDELRHHGYAKKHFLKYYPRLQPWQLRAYKIKGTIENKGRKFYFSNLRFLDKVLSPLYLFMAYVAGKITILLDLSEFNHEGKNLMEISPKSII